MAVGTKIIMRISIVEVFKAYSKQKAKLMAAPTKFCIVAATLAECPLDSLTIGEIIQLASCKDLQFEIH